MGCEVIIERRAPRGAGEPAVGRTARLGGAREPLCYDRRPMQRGELYILSAPSGAGKTTLIHALLASELGGRGEVVFSVSYTTRPPRRAERDGIDYRFVGRPEFERMIA